MTGPYIIYNGVDSRDLGVLVEKLPDLHRAPEDVELIKITGRDGRLEKANGTCDVYTDSMKINCFGVELSTVYSWLSGAGWLISSDEPNRRVRASLHPQLKNSRFRVGGKCYDTITVQMYCQPYRYHEPDAEKQTMTASPAEISNPGTAPSLPLITIKGSGDISVMVGLYQMDFEGLTDGIIVDSALEECFSLDYSALMNRSAEMDEFPRLNPGVNYVQWLGSVTSIEIEMRCRDK